MSASNTIDPKKNRGSIEPRFFAILFFLRQEMLPQHSAGAAGQVHFDEVFPGVVGIFLRVVGHMRNLTPATVLPVVAGKGYRYKIE